MAQTRVALTGKDGDIQTVDIADLAVITQVWMCCYIS
jgi:hypothetical protein